MSNYTNITNPRWATAEQDAVLFTSDVVSPALTGVETVLGTPDAGSPELATYNAIVAGTYGTVGAYQAPPEEAGLAFADLRAERDLRLAETDYYALSDVTITTAMQTYRQALRDITDTYSSLDTVVWPTKP